MGWRTERDAFWHLCVFTNFLVFKIVAHSYKYDTVETDVSMMTTLQNERQGSRGSTPGSRTHVYFFDLQNAQASSWSTWPPSHCVQCFCSQGQNRWCVKLINDIHTVSTLRRREGIPPLPLYAFILWTLAKWSDDFVSLLGMYYYQCVYPQQLSNNSQV